MKHRSITPEKLYRRRPEYLQGWVRGFYSCRLDDGASCRGRDVPYGFAGKRGRSEGLFWLGYRDGKASGRAHSSYIAVTRGVIAPLA